MAETGGEGEIGAGSAICVDDALGEQVRNGLAGDGFVGREDVIEGTIFSDDHDHVLDGRCGGLGGLLSRGRKWRSEIGDQSHEARADGKCCLTFVRKPGADMNFLLRRTTEVKLAGLALGR